MSTEQEAIAALGARVDAVEDRQDRTDNALVRINEAISVLQQAVAKVATKDDILALSQNINEKFGQQLTQAHNSIPAKVASICAVVMALLAFAGLLLGHAH